MTSKEEWKALAIVLGDQLGRADKMVRRAGRIACGVVASETLWQRMLGQQEASLRELKWRMECDEVAASEAREASRHEAEESDD